MDSWQEVHYINELTVNGHEFILFDPNSFPTISDANDELLKDIRNNKGKYDLFFNAYGETLLFPETLKQIKALGLPSLLICFDNLHVPYMHRSIAPLFDLVWLTSFETQAMFEQWGCNCYFQPYAANPYTFYPSFGDEIKTIGFIGTPYGSRVEKINDLVNAGVSCTVYSDKTNFEGKIPPKKKKLYDYWNLLQADIELLRFPIGRKVVKAELCKKLFVKSSALNVKSEYLCSRASVPFEEMNKLYSNFSLSLGITELWNTYVLSKPIYKLHLRTFEIPMCGGLQLVSYTDELANYFEDGKEIVFYSSKDEYIDKTKFYLDDRREGLRLKMKKAARYRSEYEHTWQNRFDKIFEVMNLLKH